MICNARHFPGECGANPPPISGITRFDIDDHISRGTPFVSHAMRRLLSPITGPQRFHAAGVRHKRQGPLVGRSRGRPFPGWQVVISDGQTQVLTYPVIRWVPGMAWTRGGREGGWDEGEEEEEGGGGKTVWWQTNSGFWRRVNNGCGIY